MWSRRRRSPRFRRTAAFRCSTSTWQRRRWSPTRSGDWAVPSTPSPYGLGTRVRRLVLAALRCLDCDRPRRAEPVDRPEPAVLVGAAVRRTRPSIYPHPRVSVGHQGRSTIEPLAELLPVGSDLIINAVNQISDAINSALSVLPSSDPGVLATENSGPVTSAARSQPPTMPSPHRGGWRTTSCGTWVICQRTSRRPWSRRSKIQPASRAGEQPGVRAAEPELS